MTAPLSPAEISQAVRIEATLALAVRLYQDASPATREAVAVALVVAAERVLLAGAPRRHRLRVDATTVPKRPSDAPARVDATKPHRRRARPAAANVVTRVQQKRGTR